MSATVKAGALYHYRTRDFSSRRFVFLPSGRTLDFTMSPEKLFVPENIRPDAFELREVTRPTDTYDAEHRITAGYGMADLTFRGRLRLIGGARIERSLQHLTTYDPFSPKLTPTITDLDNTDVLPSAGAIYALRPNMNLRGGYSRTLNRPEFRELAPFQFTDISGRSTIFGNPNLQRAKVGNYDARWEWFPAGTDLFAASFFWKTFDRPIERVLLFSADLLTSFYNTRRATNLGFELEMRQSLGFVSSRLEDWNIYTNYSRIHSKVDIGEIPGVVLTTLTRPLQGQAKNLFNAVLEAYVRRSYSNVRILYNFTGERISEVGATRLPDIYEQPLHVLDLAIGQRFPQWERVQLKFNIQNLLGRDITHLQGGELYYRYRPGRVFSLGLSFDIY
jgi:TonB-dependent receptor